MDNIIYLVAAKYEDGFSIPLKAFKKEASAHNHAKELNDKREDFTVEYVIYWIRLVEGD